MSQFHAVVFLSLFLVISETFLTHNISVWKFQNDESTTARCKARWPFQTRLHTWCKVNTRKLNTIYRCYDLSFKWFEFIFTVKCIKKTLFWPPNQQQQKGKSSELVLFQLVQIDFIPSSETQGQLVGTRKSLSGWLVPQNVCFFVPNHRAARLGVVSRFLTP